MLTMPATLRATAMPYIPGRMWFMKPPPSHMGTLVRQNAVLDSSPWKPKKVHFSSEPEVKVFDFEEGAYARRRGLDSRLFPTPPEKRKKDKTIYFDASGNRIVSPYASLIMEGDDLKLAHCRVSQQDIIEELKKEIKGLQERLDSLIEDEVSSEQLYDDEYLEPMVVCAATADLEERFNNLLKKS